MRTPTPRLTLCLVALAALTGLACGSPPPMHHYTIDFTPTATAASFSGGSQLGVAAPRAAHLLRQDRIVYFTADEQLNYYNYHRWAEPPVFMVQSMLIRQMRATNLFDNIVPYRAQKGLDYVLQGRLLSMEEVDRGPEVQARFALELELVREEDSHVVWTGSRSCDRPVAVKTVDAVVEALGGCVEESLGALTRSLSDRVVQLHSEARRTDSRQ